MITSSIYLTTPNVALSVSNDSSQIENNQNDDPQISSNHNGYSRKRALPESDEGSDGEENEFVEPDLKRFKGATHTFTFGKGSFGKGCVINFGTNN